MLLGAGGVGALALLGFLGVDVVARLIGGGGLVGLRALLVALVGIVLGGLLLVLGLEAGLMLRGALGIG